MRELSDLIETILDDEAYQFVTTTLILRLADETLGSLPQFGLSLHRLHFLHVSNDYLTKAVEGRRWFNTLSFIGSKVDRAELRKLCTEMGCRTAETVYTLYIRDEAHAALLKVFYA